MNNTFNWNIDLILLLIIIALLIFIIIGNVLCYWCRVKRYGVSIEQETNLDQSRTILDNLQKKIDDGLNEVLVAFNEKFPEISPVEDVQPQVDNEFLRKVEKTEYFKDYAGKVFDYLIFIELFLKWAYEKMHEMDTETTKIMSLLLLKTWANTTEMAKWKQICGDIKDSGIVIKNKDLKNCLQPVTDDERLDSFKKLCISEVRKITSVVLVLCEANSNLSKFVQAEDVSAIEGEFKIKSEEIRNKANEIGIIKIDETHIFTRIDNNEGAEAINTQASFPYSMLEDLRKDDVVEIVEFGMETEFEDMTKTKVIIKNSI